MFSITKQGHLPNAAAHTSSDSVKHTLLHYVFLSHERNSLVLVASEAHFNADFEVIMGNIIKWTIHKVTHFHCALHKTILQWGKSNIFYRKFYSGIVWESISDKNNICKLRYLTAKYILTTRIIYSGSYKIRIFIHAI